MHTELILPARDGDAPAMGRGPSGGPMLLSVNGESHGHREEQEHRLTVGATKDARLRALRHHKLCITSPFDDWAEPATRVCSQLYACENFEGFHELSQYGARPRVSRSFLPKRPANPKALRRMSW